MLAKGQRAEMARKTTKWAILVLKRSLRHLRNTRHREGEETQNAVDLVREVPREAEVEEGGASSLTQTENLEMLAEMKNKRLHYENCKTKPTRVPLSTPSRPIERIAIMKAMVLGVPPEEEASGAEVNPTCVCV